MKTHAPSSPRALLQVTVPTFIFCTSSSDPCTCTGGGFDTYGPLCDATTNATESAANETSGNLTVVAEKAKAEVSYVRGN